VDLTVAVLGFVCMNVVITEVEELTRKTKQSPKSWPGLPPVMTRLSQVKLGSVRLGREIRQYATESICPSVMKNLAAFYRAGRGFILFAAACAEQIEYNLHPTN
jgi:hypothetical protein